MIPRPLIIILIALFFLPGHGASQSKDEHLQHARRMMEAVKNGKDPSKYRKELEQASKKKLANELDSDAKKLAFWINVYNANVQILLGEDPSLFDDRDDFFGSELITVAGQELSLDAIEHGLIRHSKIKASMGHMNKPFPGSFEKRFRVEELDPRIHFAVNCGAKSCPPVAVYHADRIDRELDHMAERFLKKTTDLRDGEAHVTRLFSWFRGDFGGKDGIKEFLKGYDIIPKKADPDLVFKEYDWTMALGNFYEWDDAF